MGGRRYHLREAVEEIAAPMLEAAGFGRHTGAPRGFDTFIRDGPRGLLEAVAYYSGKRGGHFVTELAVVRHGTQPIDASPTSRGFIGAEGRRVGVRDPLGRILQGDPYYSGRDEWHWTTDEELAAKVREATQLALEHGPRWWKRQARRLRWWRWLL